MGSVKNGGAACGARLLALVPLATYPEPSLLAKKSPLLVFAGDAFGGHSRMEGAALSGLDAGKVLAERVGS